MRASKAEPSKALHRLLTTPAKIRMSAAERIVVSNLPLIRKAMRAGHGLVAISNELSISKSALQTHLSRAGLFFRTPRKNKGAIVRPKKSAIARAKNAILANV
jgi:hypothetical protein